MCGYVRTVKIERVVVRAKVVAIELLRVRRLVLMRRVVSDAPSSKSSLGRVGFAWRRSAAVT
jgi:hypothetical protein